MNIWKSQEHTGLASATCLHAPPPGPLDETLNQSITVHLSEPFVTSCDASAEVRRWLRWKHQETELGSATTS